MGLSTSRAASASCSSCLSPSSSSSWPPVACAVFCSSASSASSSSARAKPIAQSVAAAWMKESYLPASLPTPDTALREGVNSQLRDVTRPPARPPLQSVTNGTAGGAARALCFLLLLACVIKLMQTANFSRRTHRRDFYCFAEELFAHANF